MNWDVVEQLEALSAARRKPALDRENEHLYATYAGQYVAYTDDWNDRYELTRTVLAASPDRAEFERLWDAISPQLRFRVKSVGIPPADPLPEPPKVDRRAIYEKLRAMNYKTPAQRAALQRAHDELCERYPGQDVAYIDEWNGEELTRTVVAAALTCADFHKQLRELPADLCNRVEMTQVPDPHVVDCPSVWFE
jgi:hypothetical protein